MFNITSRFLYEYGPYLLALGFTAVVLFGVYSKEYGEHVRNTLIVYKKFINVGLFFGIIMIISWFALVNTDSTSNIIIFSTILSRLILALLFIGAFLFTWSILEQKDNKHETQPIVVEHPPIFSESPRHQTSPIDTLLQEQSVREIHKRALQLRSSRPPLVLRNKQAPDSIPPHEGYLNPLNRQQHRTENRPMERTR